MNTVTEKKGRVHSVRTLSDVFALHKRGQIRKGDSLEYECGLKSLVIGVGEEGVREICQGRGEYIEESLSDERYGVHLLRVFPTKIEVCSGRKSKPDTKTFTRYQSMLEETENWERRN